MRTFGPKEGRKKDRKSGTRSSRTKLMAPNKCHGIFFVHWSGQVPYSINTSKENVSVYFHHNMPCSIFYR